MPADLTAAAVIFGIIGVLSMISWRLLIIVLTILAAILLGEFCNQTACLR